jgi:hypothetical protein
MSAYLAGLAAAVESEHNKEAQRQRGLQVAARERLTPLEVRLSRLLATIPMEVQREGLSLAHLQTSLRGRWRGHCHPGELGEALRKLGFVRERCWRAGVGFRALWHPLTLG